MSLAATVASMVAGERAARAEADNFALGDGHHGAFTATQNQQVVNAYAPITANVAAGAVQIPIGTVVGHADGFQAGDLVLVWRATGVPADGATSGSATRIDLTTAGGAGGPVGVYEFARVTNATATALTLTRPLVHAFAANVSQVVKVREYTTLSVPVNPSPSPHPWSQSGASYAGGLLAFLATDHQRRLDVGRGSAAALPGTGSRRPAPGSARPSTAPNNGYATGGEGVHSRLGPTVGGRGNVANGGGGGNCVESGGGAAR